MDSTDKIRATRRRRKHERQAVIFGVLIAFLAVSGGALSLPNEPEFIVTEEKGITLAQQPACVPPDTEPLPYAKVHVTVLNGSNRGGLAGSVSKSLTDRGFTVDSTGNDTRKPTRALITSGDDGIAHAYTLLAHYPDSQLVLDARPGSTVDFTVPEGFVELEAEELVQLSADTALVSVTGCVEVGKITPLPAPDRFDDADEGKKEKKKKSKKKKKAKAEAAGMELDI